jgi:hypothetical protein
LILHPSEHEEFLATLLAGELRPESTEVQRRLRECAPCRAEWERLRRTVVGLAHAATERGAVLAGQGALRGAPGEERLLETLAGLADERNTPSPRRFSRTVLLVGAAASVLAGWLAWRNLGTAPVSGPGPAPAPRPPHVLGEGALELLAPVGLDADFSRFVWKYDGRTPRFRLRVFELLGDERGPECIPEIQCRETNWVPSAELLAKLPLAIEWEVSVADDFDRWPVVLSEQAWRSSR